MRVQYVDTVDGEDGQGLGGGETVLLDHVRLGGHIQHLTLLQVMQVHVGVHPEHYRRLWFQFQVRQSYLDF